VTLAVPAKHLVDTLIDVMWANAVGTVKQFEVLVWVI